MRSGWENTIFCRTSFSCMACVVVHKEEGGGGGEKENKYHSFTMWSTQGQAGKVRLIGCDDDEDVERRMGR